MLVKLRVCSLSPALGPRDCDTEGIASRDGYWLLEAVRDAQLISLNGP